MNKLALVAAALLVLSLLALPRVVGSVTEARVRERVAAIDASPSAAAELTSFDRGWFRSSARIELGLVPDDFAALGGNAGAPLGAFGTLPIVVDFAHGPIAVHVVSDQDYAAWVAQAKQKWALDDGASAAVASVEAKH